MASGDENIRYIQENVLSRVNGPHREEMIPGRLQMTNERHGVVISWTPVETSPLIKSVSPDDDTCTWEELSAETAVEFKNGREDMVEIRNNNKKKPCPFQFEIDDLNSYHCAKSKRLEGHELTLFLRDGATLPALVFAEDRHRHFIRALEEFVKFQKSRKDCHLYLVVTPEREALEKSFEELNLFTDAKSNLISRFFHDPYSTTMHGFAKVTNLVVGNNWNMGSIDDMMELQPDSFTGLEISHHEEPGFEVIVRSLPVRPEVTRLGPLTHEEWVMFYDSDGRITEVQKLKERVFRGGVHPDLRKEVWKFLLGYYDYQSTYKEREQHRKKKVEDYFRMKLQWKTISEDQESRFTDFRDRKSLVDKDVNRTDRTHTFYEGQNNPNLQMLYDILMTYCMHNFDLGYVQGMSDLLSPLLIVLENEADTFWCFVEFLSIVSSNFEMDQQGMKTQLQHLHDILSCALPQLTTYLDDHESGNLYFCFRWLLILFKREFKFEEIMNLWEILWTGVPCKNFHLLLCAAILDTEKNTLMENNYGLNEILKHINDMSYKIPLEETLAKAESIFLQLSQCSTLPQIVQDILGIDIEPPPSQDLTLAGNLEDSAVSSTATKPKDSPQSSSSVEVLSDADLELKYQTAFELLS